MAARGLGSLRWRVPIAVRSARFWPVPWALRVAAWSLLFAVVFGVLAAVVNASPPALAGVMSVAALLGALVAVRTGTRAFVAAPFVLQAALDGVETDRLLLRTPTADDAQAVAATIDFRVENENGWRPGMRELEIRLCRKPHTAGHAAWVLMADRTDGTIIGSLDVSGYDPRHSVCMLGWWTGRAHRAQGYGTEAVRAAIAALHQAGVRKVVIATLPTNTGVRRVAERLGMHQGASRPYQLPNQKWVSAVFYIDGISDAEWTTAG